MTETGGLFVLLRDMFEFSRRFVSWNPAPSGRFGFALGMILALVATGGAMEDETRSYALPAGDAAVMLARLSTASGREILFGAEIVRGVRTQAVRGAFTAQEAVGKMLAGTELAAIRDDRTGALAIRRRSVLAAMPDPAVLRAALMHDFATTVAQPARAHRGPVMQALEPLLIQQARFLVAEIQPWPREPRGSKLPLLKGAPSGEHGIRPNAHTAKGLALLARLLPDSAFPPEFSRRMARERALALLRYLLPTCGAGGGHCDDGRSWRGQWQSAYWAALAGEACWLLWDDLAPEERWLAARMITDEAERFADAVPPAALLRDTKAEENAWNSQILSLAGLMFPGHPRAARWREAAIRWIASSFARPADLTCGDRVDGRPLREWLAGANLFDDFTLENHGRVHPDYMACTYLLTSQVPMYAWGGRAPPAALDLNVAAINTVLKRLALPDGAWIYPNGQDWGLRRNIDWFEYHTGMAVRYGDAQSATLQRQCLATMRRMAARTPDGPIYLPTEVRLPSDQSMALELPAHAYALMAQLGEGPTPLPGDQLMTDLAGRYVFASGKFGVLRTRTSIATFSWGAQVMGQVMPLREDQLLAPEVRGLIGYVAAPGVAREVPMVREVVLASRSDLLGVAGVLDRAGGTVAQRFAFLALPDGRVIYADQVQFVGGDRPAQLDLGTLGVLNDRNWPGHNGTRVLAYAGGARAFAAATAERDSAVDLPSRWFNLDGLGIVGVAVSGAARYVPAPTGAAGRLEQRFHLNVVPAATLAGAEPGTTLAYGLWVFYPGQTAAATRDVAARCRLRGQAGDPKILLTLDDDSEVMLDLTHLRIEWSGGAPR